MDSERIAIGVEYLKTLQEEAKARVLFELLNEKKKELLREHVWLGSLKGMLKAKEIEKEGGEGEPKKEKERETKKRAASSSAQPPPKAKKQKSTVKMIDDKIKQLQSDAGRGANEQFKFATGN
jgi:hypothetical protein